MQIATSEMAPGRTISSPYKAGLIRWKDDGIRSDLWSGVRLMQENLAESGPVSTSLGIHSTGILASYR